MKLKYYLRGLGIGIFATVIILTIASLGKKKDLTDEEIIARAKELGMVMEDRSGSIMDHLEEDPSQGQPSDTENGSQGPGGEGDGAEGDVQQPEDGQPQDADEPEAGSDAEDAGSDTGTAGSDAGDAGRITSDETVPGKCNDASIAHNRSLLPLNLRKIQEFRRGL